MVTSHASHTKCRVINVDLHFGANAHAEVSCCPVLPCMLAVKRSQSFLAWLVSSTNESDPSQSCIVQILSRARRKGGGRGGMPGGGGRD